MQIQQAWDLGTARCRFGKFLRVAVNGKAPDIQRLVRGLVVRLAVRRDHVVAELQLGEDAKFFPSDAALASWMAQADKGQAQIVYE